MERKEDANGARNARYPAPGDTLRSGGPTCYVFALITISIDEHANHLAPSQGK